MHILVTEDTYQHLRLMAFYGATTMNDLINTGIQKILKPVKKENK